MKKQHLFHILYCLLLAFLFLTIGSKNSFLYRINDWWDAQAFFTVGKGMVHGLVPYRDLFEQKGIVLYAIYGISSLISEHNFLGVYFFEIIAFTLFLYYARKTIRLYVREKYADFLLLLIALFITTSSPFGHGGSAEEFTMPLFMISLYYLGKFFKEGKITRWEILLNGFLAGLVLWIKYSLLGFWFIWAAALFFINIFNKHYKEAFLSSLIFLLGMLIASLPWLGYFAYHHALKELVDVYFFFNATTYAKDITIFEKLIRAILLLGKNLLLNPVYLFGIVIPIIIILIKGKIKDIKAFITLLSSILFTGLATFIGGKGYFYYGLILAPFIIIGGILLGKYFEKKDIEMTKWFLSSSLIIGLIMATFMGNYTYMIKYQKSDYAQFTFAEIIKDQKVLNYDFLDGGFYFTTNQIPKYYYFMRNNVDYESYPILFTEQKRYIVEDKPEYIVTRKSATDIAKIPEINNCYHLVKSHTQKYEKRQITYYLYQKNVDA